MADGPFAEPTGSASVTPQPVQTIGGGVSVSMRRTATQPTADLPLWVIIRRATEAISFENYLRFMDLLLCGIVGSSPSTDTEPKFGNLRSRRFLPYNDADAYRLLKVATEAFLMVNCGIVLQTPGITQQELDKLIAGVSLESGAL